MFRTTAAIVILTICMPLGLIAQQQKVRTVVTSSETQIETQFHTSRGVIVLDSAGASLAGGSGAPLVFSINATPAIAFGDSASMLVDQRVQKELELMADQQQMLTDIRADFEKRITEMRQARKTGDSDEENQKRHKAIQRLRDERTKMMEQVLLPHQVERLRQVSLQLKMKQHGDVEMLTGDLLAEKLGIDEVQKQRIEQRAEEIKQQMQKEIAEIKEKGRKQLLNELTSRQRRELEEMLGVDYEDDRIKRK